ncbi:glycosyl transferase [Rhodococcus sp. 1163]|uniref:glycosyltransferase n=1 Tax=Rhodococcus sp. 1163 TaxID=1905289 RepID=UPI0009FD5277|nr:glycosyltransferase [Rhodococcus sp. 1163]ORI13907.1 glycosyl transferase [Rhodococcus sp. 1163]
MTGTVDIGDGRILVPDNEWDRVHGPSRCPVVSVIIPYYDQPSQLSLVLAALAEQTYPADRLEVVVADDGSSQPPPIDRWCARLDIVTIRQEDKGFRAAAARNLGVSASRGSILCFLDADTVPTPDYIRAATRLPSLLPDALVVGRRKHSSAAVTEPAWLVDAYERTGDLLHPGWDAYKYMISAVMTCGRSLFDAIGGFDESFVQYGGEDWEFANRAFMAGAVFAYERTALAWHDGPDWAERSVSARTDSKNAEALKLAPLITDPAARRSGLRYRVPDCVVIVASDSHSAASLSVTIATSVGAAADCGVWIVGANAANLYHELGLDDSRVHLDEPDDWIRARCRFVVEVSGRVVFGEDSLQRLCAEVGPGAAGGVKVDFAGDSSSSESCDAALTVWTSRALHRSRRWVAESGRSESELMNALFGVRRASAATVGVQVARSEPWLSW